MNTQVENGPLECIAEKIKECGFPKEAIISIGATRYTEFGESTYLMPKDEIFVVLYDKELYAKTDILRKISNGSYQAPEISTLHQVVI
jgi:hypothetical protein